MTRAEFDLIVAHQYRAMMKFAGYLGASGDLVHDTNRATLRRRRVREVQLRARRPAHSRLAAVRD